MKKLFATLLVLCLLGSAALAEEAPAIVLDWTEIGTEDVKAYGSDQLVQIPDVANINYWLPSVLEPVDLSGIDAEIAPYAAYQTNDGVYTMSVYTLTITGLEDYLNGLAETGVDEFNTLLTNGISGITCENKENDLDIVVIPVTDTIVLSFAFTPLDGDEDWDATKATIVASIRVAE